jgi:hypothetical protein
MCNPLAIGAVLAVAGTGLQIRAQNQREADMNRAQRRETERQEKLYGESKLLLDQNREEYNRERVDADMATAAADRQAQYAAADRNAPRANESLPGSTPAAGGNVVVLEAFRQAAADAATRAEQQGAARADLASFGDFMGDTAISTGRRSGDIGMIGSFSRGSANVLPLELNRAATRRRGSATAGNLLTSFGSAMMGGAGAGAAATGTAGAASGLGNVSGIGAGLAGGTRYASQAPNLFAGLAGGP